MGQTKRVEDIMTAGCQSIGEHDSIVEAAKRMKQQGVGALPISGEDGQLRGMLTDRDIVVEVISKGLDPAATEVGALGADGNTVVVRSQAGLEEAMDLMSAQQVRRLPVVDDVGMVVGMISQADIAAHADSDRSGEMLASISAA